MKEYYFNEYKKSTLQLEIARIGYASKMKALGTKLATADESQHDSILEAINDLRVALNEMVDESNRMRKRYREYGGVEDENCDEDI